MKWLAVAVGGACGAMLRYGIAVWTKPTFSGPLPWQTLIANVLGACLMGFFFVWFQRLSIADELKLLLTTGFLGALTTFSTLALETVTLWQEGRWDSALLYLVGTAVVGITALWLGMFVAGRLFAV